MDRSGYLRLGDLEDATLVRRPASPGYSLGETQPCPTTQIFSTPQQNWQIGNIL